MVKAANPVAAPLIKWRRDIPACPPGQNFRFPISDFRLQLKIEN